MYIALTIYVFKGTITPPVHSKSFIRKSFSYNAVKLFNNLPHDIKYCITQATFKIKL